LLAATKLTGDPGAPWTVFYDHVRLLPEADAGLTGAASIVGLLVLRCRSGGSPRS
jgi:hypothetical protein